MPCGWPWNSPGCSGVNLLFAHHSPWLSVYQTTPSGAVPTPAGERRPAQTGSNEPPSAGMRTAQPRQGALPNGSPPNGLLSVSQNEPSPAIVGPKQYSW